MKQVSFILRSSHFAQDIESAEAMWPLYIGPHHLLSDLAAVVKTLWQTQADDQKIAPTNVLYYRSRPADSQPYQA